MARKTRYAVIGMGRFGQTLALALAEGGSEVIAIDHREELIAEIADKVAHAVALDATNERALKSQGIADVDVVVVAFGENFEATVLTTMLLKSMRVRRIVCRAVSSREQRVLEMLGAEVIAPERDSALRLAGRLLKPGLLDNITVSEGLSIAHVLAPKHWVGRTIKDLDVRRRYNCNIVALKRMVARGSSELELTSVISIEAAASVTGHHESVVRLPKPDDKLIAGDVLLVLGRDEDVAKLGQAT